MREGYPAAEDEQRCECVADEARIEVGGNEYEANFSGEMAVRAGEPFESDGVASVPLVITGHETVGEVGDLGQITVSRDPDREAPVSILRENQAGEGFPATQEMMVNIHVTLAALPGFALRNTKTGILRNSDQQGFPPRNARYELQEPLDLERVDEPGEVVARILAYTANINPDNS
ncbi:MAG TPA: hypothetical protein VFS54_08250 [Solirubrobacterales bacterium]|nr:hypothetical protein [Solirubrobacterales bacterium]